ncbi:hypothetical protein SBFV3_gp03 [Sulfolobales Beppu filamentous virus 3]|uniref:Uncharacterized protein n=1 Tax=Sulfolobales Beppu filamentous virus 3 TaxID=2493124 RepID=A0A3S8NF16_9VIRU|nr:hypothetical protein HOU83_gp03 [Sulfolobales Beppu filamentous virus 3]AZI75838.1 hypothetical protein SBFV3_gp03 [Sulfolobales Beppu filamentous virus 3]
MKMTEICERFIENNVECHVNGDIMILEDNEYAITKIIRDNSKTIIITALGDIIELQYDLVMEVLDTKKYSLTLVFKL